MPRGKKFQYNKLKNQRPRPPKSLRGKDIGLYFRDLHKNGGGLKKDKFAIHLTIPHPVITSICRNIENIEKIAKEKNIYLPPIMKFRFVETARNADFIPIKVPESEKKTALVTNIHPRDDDVVLVKTEVSEAITISDSEDADTKLEANSVKMEQAGNIHICISDSEDDAPVNFKTDSIKADEADNPKSASEQSEKPTFIVPEIDVPKIKQANKHHFVPKIDDSKSTLEQADKPSYFVSNHYTDTPSTSNAGTANNKRTRDTIDSLGNYKYGYEDIITGTFEEKLDECLAKGITINHRSNLVDDLNCAMKEELKLMVNMNDKYKNMLRFRETLPTYKRSKYLLDMINNNQVTVVSGETGCGKSTQVPQLILDEAINNNKGAQIKILVTQPRRIAASSLAMRVAEERGEPMGNAVGYSVRLESVQSRERGSIMFCTTGVLLVELELNQGLTNYSHVILDEVHERDCQVDIAMCMLKQVLKKRKDLKLILMSATLDADKLSSYFDKCPMIHIEGLAYPVKDIYLEEILERTEFQLPPLQQTDEEFDKPRYKHMKRKRQAFDMEKDIKYKAEIAPWLESIKRNLHKESYKTLQDSRIEELNMQLIVRLLITICRGEPGAILVFLPGISDISNLMRSMDNSRAFPKSYYDIHPLHSKLPTLTQHKIFARPPNHKRKIVIATNIAETSITIDDVVYVVDCGKIKMKGLNVEENIPTLQTEWVAKANLRQRRGRAGRCQPGICFHLITSYRADTLADRLQPEMQRSDLLETVLCIKRLRLGKAAEALRTMPAVPAEKTIQWAVRHLQQLGALDEKETLTPLGWHLARLPVHPAAGKLLVLGALFGCLDRAASVAAVWGFKEPFQLAIGKEIEAAEAKRNLALGEPSDHVAISEAIIQWELCSHGEGRRRFAYENFLSMYNLQLLSEMKKQFAGNLKQMGFLVNGEIKSAWENRNAGNLSLFKAIVAASLYPNIATVQWTKRNFRNPNKPMRINVRTPEEGKVSLHPSSIMFTRMQCKNHQPLCMSPGANWLVYWLKQKSSDLFLIDVTCVYTLPLLFFGELNVSQGENHDECLISISSVKVSCSRITTELLFALRSLLDKVIASKIMDSNGQSARHHRFDQQVLNAVIELITAEDEGAEYIDDNDSEHSSDYNESRRWRNDEVVEDVDDDSEHSDATEQGSLK